MSGILVVFALIIGAAIGAVGGSVFTSKRLARANTAAPRPLAAGSLFDRAGSDPASSVSDGPPPPAKAPAPVAPAAPALPTAPAPLVQAEPPAPAPRTEVPPVPVPRSLATSAPMAAPAPIAGPVPVAAAPASMAPPVAVPTPTSMPAPMGDTFVPATVHPSTFATPTITSTVTTDVWDTSALAATGDGDQGNGRVLWAPPPADLAEEVAKVPRRRREDFLPESDRIEADPLPQAELPPGWTDPITGLPLAEAMRADIELRATDFKTFTVVVCHPMMAMTTPGGMVNVSPNAAFGQEELRIFAGVLRDTLRQKDIVGRYDERLFLLFLPRCKVDEVRIVMDRIRANLLLAQIDQPQWVDITFGAAAGQIGESVDGPLKVAYADLLQRNTGPAWFLQA